METTGTQAQAAAVLPLIDARAAYRAALAGEVAALLTLRSIIVTGGRYDEAHKAYMEACAASTQALQALTVALGLEWIDVAGEPLAPAPGPMPPLPGVDPFGRW